MPRWSAEASPLRSRRHGPPSNLPVTPSNPNPNPNPEPQPQPYPTPTPAPNPILTPTLTPTRTPIPNQAQAARAALVAARQPGAAKTARELTLPYP